MYKIAGLDSSNRIQGDTLWQIAVKLGDKLGTGISSYFEIGSTKRVISMVQFRTIDLFNLQNSFWPCDIHIQTTWLNGNIICKTKFHAGLGILPVENK